jgi:hypothetical protein
MKQAVLRICLLLLFGTLAEAQDVNINGTFGLRFEAIPNALSNGRPTPVYPVLGFHLGLEIGTNQWRGGLRAGVNSLLIFSISGQVELYGRYILESSDSLLFGVGTRVSVHVFNSSWQDVHMLLGYRFASGFFVELQPAVAFGQRFSNAPYDFAQVSPILSVFVATAAIGWSWHF